MILHFQYNQLFLIKKYYTLMRCLKSLLKIDINKTTLHYILKNVNDSVDRQ